MSYSAQPVPANRNDHYNHGDNQNKPDVLFNVCHQHSHAAKQHPKQAALPA